MPGSPAPTASQVNRAGQTLRRWMREPAVENPIEVPDKVADAFGVLLRFRAAHSDPLVKANNGLRSMVRTEGCRVEVSQRLKRTPTIVNKLIREPTLALSRMQDIGGCRAVLGSIDEVRRVQRRLSRARPPVTVSDYIDNPRSSGYRGVHVVVRYADRTIEVQLRTTVMHEWAITVEKLAGRLSAQLKGDGEHPVQQLMSVISMAMAAEERGETVGDDLLEEMRRLRNVAAPFLEGSR